MQSVRFTEDVRPISDLKLHAAEVVDQARRSHRPVLLTRRGRGVAVLLDVEDYERLADRAFFVEGVEAGAPAPRRPGLLAGQVGDESFEPLQGEELDAWER